ncbi:ABC transporter permease, partial [Dickeya dianthicola]
MMSGLNRNLAVTALQRLFTIVAVLWGAATLTFIAVKLIPGDPVAILSGGDNMVDAAYRAALIKQFGLDQPLWMQYLRYCGQALQGDFGVSYQYRQPVAALIGDAMRETIQLALSALALALLLSILNALLTAGRHARLRALMSWLELTLLSTPVYWVGIVLLSVFSFHLQWFPVMGNDGLISLVLPVITLSLPLAALLSQVLRDGLEEALSQPFALTVRTRGVSETWLR